MTDLSGKLNVDELVNHLKASGLPVVLIDEKFPPAPYTSCFLPGTNIQYAWDSTSLGWFKTCPRLYEYNMIQGWQTPDESVHLRFGIEYHWAIEAYEKCLFEGQNHEDAVFNIIKELLIRTDEWRPDHAYKNRDHLIRSIVWYLDQYKNDTAKTYKMKDGSPAVELSFRFELDWGPEHNYDLKCVNGHDLCYQGVSSECPYCEKVEGTPYLLCGHLDRVVEYNDELFVMDHKTTKTTPSEYYYNQYNPNNQMTLYTLASQVIFDAPVKGVIIDVGQVAVGFTRFGRGFTYRTNEQIEEWVNDLSSWFKLAEQYALDGYWPMNDTACDKFGGCAFREICSKSPQVRDAFLKSNFIKREESEKWNPLIPR